MSTCVTHYPSFPKDEVIQVETNETVKIVKEKALKLLETVRKVAACTCYFLVENLLTIPWILVEGGVQVQHMVSKCFSSYSQRPKAVILRSPAATGIAGNLPFTMDPGARKLYSDYQVENYTVSSFNDVNKYLKTKCNDASLIILFGHACSSAIAIDPSSDLEVGSICSGNVKNLDFSNVSQEASLIIKGCEAGKKENDQISIAQKIAKVAGGRKVYAPVESILTPSLEITYHQNKAADVKFYSCVKGADSRIDRFYDFLTAPIAGMYSSISSAQHPWFATDVTASYQYT